MAMGFGGDTSPLTALRAMTGTRRKGVSPRATPASASPVERPLEAEGGGTDFVKTGAASFLISAATLAGEAALTGLATFAGVKTFAGVTTFAGAGLETTAATLGAGVDFFALVAGVALVGVPTTLADRLPSFFSNAEKSKLSAAMLTLSREAIRMGLKATHAPRLKRERRSCIVDMEGHALADRIYA